MPCTTITFPISHDLIEAGSDTTLSIPSPPDHRRRRRWSSRSSSKSIYTSNDHATKRVKVNNRITQPISDKIWYSERMVYHEMVVAKVLQFGVFCTGGVRGIPH